MTTWIIGAAIGLFVLRRLRESFSQHLQVSSTKGQDLKMVANAALSSTMLGAAVGMLDDAADGQSAARGQGKIRWAVTVGVRLGSVIWLYNITDGAAFSPFAFVSDLPGGSMWQVALVVLGLSEVLGRVGAMAFRAVTGRTHEHPATAEPMLTR